MKDWQEDMDKLVAQTAKNWWKTGNCTRSMGVTGSLSLAQGHKKNLDDKDKDGWALIDDLHVQNALPFEDGWEDDIDDYHMNSSIAGRAVIPVVFDPPKAPFADPEWKAKHELDEVDFA